MITFEDAKKIALNYIPETHKLIFESIEEIDIGWYFMSQTEAYLKSRDISKMSIGYGGFVVDHTGEIIDLGSGQSKEDSFKGFKLGLHCYCHLKITRVKKVWGARRKVASMLLRLQMTYVISEEAHGEIWRIPELYTESQIKKQLKKLPCTFNDLNLGFRLKELEEFIESDMLEFELIKTDKRT